MTRWITLIGVVVLALAPAAAQTAPAGNAHPQGELVTSIEESTRTFGPMREAPLVTPKEKHAFAEKLNLDPLRDLAVSHRGRVKILDTLGRETVRTLTGTHNYYDLIPDDNGKLRKAGYDPLFTLLDLSIDPMYYANKPLVHVTYLPLREAYLELALPDDPAQRERWKKLTRISPVAIERFSTQIFNEHADSEQFRRGLAEVEQGEELAFESEQNFLIIAPETRQDRWLHASELPPDSPARQACLALGEAWRNMDADGVNAAVQKIAQILPTIHPEIYPQGRRALELTYNQSHAFEWGYWTYLVSFLMLVLAFGTGRKWLIVGGVALLCLAIGMHGFGFISRCIIAERFAIQNQFESMTGISLFAALVGLGAMLVRRQWLFGAAAAGTGFLVLITATQTGIPGETIGREAAILNTSVLLKYHVTTVLTSYGLITLGFICSLFYLGTHYGQKFFGSKADVVAMASNAVVPSHGQTEINTGPQRTLHDLDKAQMTILQLAFWTLGVGILLGAWWADHSWGRWWGFDPKETWALVTWIVYLIVIHLRFASVKNKALVTAWLSVAGFFVMLWTYFGVNLLLPGLHAYA